MMRRFGSVLLASGVLAGASLLLFVVVGCSAQEGAQAAQATPKRVTEAELKKLRWIEGTWRGTGDVEKPFYERYYFENDSTLVVEGFPDETVSKANDVTRFVLKEGQFGNTGEGSLWAASQLDDNSITFVPLAKARNWFRWERRSQDEWKAVIGFPASDKGPARERVYKMERWAAPKQQ